MDKDMLFAEATLDKDELELYQQVYSNMTSDSPKPDLVVYLQAPFDTLLARIQRSRNKSLKQIHQDYLRKIADAYAHFFHYYDESPLLIVNASGLDIVNKDADYEQLKSRILEVQGGRHYFNPVPFDS
jgi:deoxyadenosine/deoxycytidine kinase